MRVLQPHRLFTNKPLRKPFLHKTCFYTNTVFTQALSLHKHCFYTSPALHKSVFTKDLLLHKRCLYTSAVFTQDLSLHKHSFYTSPAFTQKRFYTRPVFTQTLSLHKLCLYTSIVFIQALLLHNDICSHKPSATCKQATGWRAGGMPKAVKKIYIYILYILYIYCDFNNPTLSVYGLTALGMQTCNLMSCSWEA